MAFVDCASREVNCKVVYCGPELCGKTDNLQFIYKNTNPGARGKLVALATQTDRTLFFDLLPPDLGDVRGFRTRLHLYTVPGQVYYHASRKVILKGVDGVVFVADSRRERLDENLESLRTLERDLEDQGYDLRSIPYVLQLNLRDSPTAVPREEMIAKLRLGTEPVLEAITHSEDGTGVFDTLKAIAKLVLRDVAECHAAPRGPVPSFSPKRSNPVPPRPVRVRSSEDRPQERPRIRFNPDAPVSHEIRFAPAPGFPVQDLVALLVFPYAFLVGTALFLEPGAGQHLAVNAAYWLASIGGALWIHRRNGRGRLAA